MAEPTAEAMEAVIPWRVDGRAILDCGGERVMLLSGWRDHDCLDVTVRAVNSYDAMREMLVNIKEAYDGTDDDHEFGEIAAVVITGIEAVLATGD